jgi:hypothetical protein
MQGYVRALYGAPHTGSGSGGGVAQVAKSADMKRPPGFTLRW